MRPKAVKGEHFNIPAKKSKRFGLPKFITAIGGLALVLSGVTIYNFSVSDDIIDITDYINNEYTDKYIYAYAENAIETEPDDNDVFIPEMNLDRYGQDLYDDTNEDMYDEDIEEDIEIITDDMDFDSNFPSEKIELADNTEETAAIENKTEPEKTPEKVSEEKAAEPAPVVVEKKVEEVINDADLLIDETEQNEEKARKLQEELDREREKLAEIPSVPVPKGVTFGEDGTVYTNNEPDNNEEPTIRTSNEPTPTGRMNGETFKVKYNGGTHTVDGFELVCAITAKEMSDSFSDEAIKAQAVAAYSYVKNNNANGLTPSVIVNFNYSSKIERLVREVYGVGVYYRGNIAQTPYVASTGGYTASSETVWGGAKPYLVSVECPFDTKDPNYGVAVTYSEREMKSALESSLGVRLSGSPDDWLRIIGYVDGNYVSAIDVDGQKTISGRQLREDILNFKIKSAAFDVHYANGEFVITTYGYGHGVGMSQNGANILAKQGYSYVDILRYYYTGVEIR